ncbi:MAG: hypothetical protein PVG35_13845 [Desulfobacterales bacterium]|jgi:hypothetical protein
MGGRFGKYGDLKRRKALQRSRKEKYRMERAKLTTLRSRSGLLRRVQSASFQNTTKTYNFNLDRPR